jgi:hypothetical protein
MPRRRLQTDPGLGNPQLRPAARPVDTFVPASASGSQAAQLANALSHLAPSLAQFGDQLFERKSKQDLQAGAERARETLRELDESRKTFADAVREGTIPAHMNPWMKQGYYEELGRTYAGRLQADLTSAIELDENLKDSVEMGDYRKFVSDFEQKWLEENVPQNVQNGAFGIGYGNRRDAILANLEAGWSAQTEERFTQRTLALFRDEAVTFMQDALDQDRPAAEIATVLRQMLDDKRSIGWAPRLTGTALIDAVASVALERKDAELFEEVTKGLRGPGEPSRSYVIEKGEELDTAIFQAKRREWERSDRERSEAGRNIEASALQRFAEAEQKGLDPDDISIADLQSQAISLGLPATSERLALVKESYQNREYSDDNDVVRDLEILLHSHSGALTQGRLDSELRDKNISLQTYSRLSNALHERGGGKAFLEEDPDYKEGEQAIMRLFTSSSPDEDTWVLRYRREQALRQYKRWYIDNYLTTGAAPGSAPQSKERAFEVEDAVQRFFQTWLHDTIDADGNLRLSGEDFDWRSRPVDHPSRLEPVLDELEAFLQNGSDPSPQLTSLLRVYRVNTENIQELQEFLETQRRLTTELDAQLRPKKKKVNGSPGN